MVYNRPVICNGPVFRKCVKENGAVRILFDHTYGGLNSKHGKIPHFEIAGPNGAYLPACADIQSDTIVVNNPEIEFPSFVRYAWSDDPCGCDVYNSANLPLAPFMAEIK
jgi:sialate O-acetylesterase